jgi:hypothetical protein
MRRAPSHNPRTKSKGDLMSRPPITIVLTVREQPAHDGTPGASVDDVVLHPGYDARASITRAEPTDADEIAVNLSVELAPWHEFAIPESLRALRG